MLKQALAFIALMALTACGHGDINKKIAPKVADYKEKASLLVSLSGKMAPAKRVRKLSLELIEDAKPIISLYKKKYPKCVPVLDEIVAKSKYMTTISLKRIEEDYHDGGALPETPEECYNAKELIVHPATVVILTNKKYTKDGREQIKDEMDEVIGHIDNLL